MANPAESRASLFQQFFDCSAEALFEIRVGAVEGAAQARLFIYKHKDRAVDEEVLGRSPFLGWLFLGYKFKPADGQSSNFGFGPSDKRPLGKVRFEPRSPLFENLWRVIARRNVPGVCPWQPMTTC